MGNEKIALGINLRKNKNSQNSGFGKYYPEVDLQKTLSLRGLAQHMTDHGSIYKRDIVEGVLMKITECLPELVSQGVPVKLGGLGTFYPTAEVENGAGVSGIAGMVGLNPNQVVKGIHIRFLPDATKMDSLRGPAFKNKCSMELRNIVDTKEVTIDGKPKKVQTLKPIATAVAEWKAENGGNEGSSGSNSSGEGSSESLAAPVISGTTPFTDSTSMTISGPQGASIYYTTDGSTPTSSSTQYSSAVTLTATTTVKAIAILNGVSSSVTTKEFTKSSGGSGDGIE